MRATVCSIASLVLCAAPKPQQNPCVVGDFEDPFNHTNNHSISAFRFVAAEWTAMGQVFHSLHMALIPVGPHRGKIVAWNYGAPDPMTGASPGTQFWTIIDPAAAPTDPDKFMNFKFTVPPTNGKQNDLACAGHTLLPDGRLFVVGGTEKYATPQSGGAIVGAKLTYVFDPTVDPLAGNPPGSNMWMRQPDLQKKRWYPTATLTDANTILAAGGDLDDTTVFPPLFVDGYEVWNFNATPGWENQRYRGPYEINPAWSWLWAYPRLHLLSSSEVFMAGMLHDPTVTQHVTSVVEHHVAPESWRAKDSDFFYRQYGTSVLYPNIDAKHTDAAMIIGGQIPAETFVATASTRICKASAQSPGGFDAIPQGYSFKNLPSMANGRVYLNAVLLPDASVLAIGGQDDIPDAGGARFVYEAERYSGGSGGSWQTMDSMTANRGYHSTALLLPSGKVLVAAGESRGLDYEVYAPPYLGGCSPRPVWQAPFPPENVVYGGEHVARYAGGDGMVVNRVVLMRPGSVTHHFDQDQRYVRLSVSEDNPPGTITFALPSNPGLAPPGYYMIFLVSTAGIPSVARWIHLQ